MAGAGVLDKLVHHDYENLTGVNALLKGLLPPLERALDSYRERAAATKQTYAHVVELEYAVQTWWASTVANSTANMLVTWVSQCLLIKPFLRDKVTP